MSTCGRGADGRMRGSAPPARIRGSRARPGGRYFLIHRTKASRPLLARLSGHRTANGSLHKCALSGNQTGDFGKQEGDFVWTERPEKRSPSLRESWRMTQNWGLMVSRHCPLDLTAMVGLTNVLCTCPIMPETGAKVSSPRSSTSTPSRSAARTRCSLASAR